MRYLNKYDLPMSREREAELSKVTPDFRRTNGFMRKARGNKGMADCLQIRALHIAKEVNSAERADTQPDSWFVLVDTSTKKRIKMTAMSHADAEARNASIASLGYAWVRGEM